jgi:hypothetical protein
MNHQHLIRLASTGKKPRDVLSSGHVAKVFPHSGNYNGLGRGLFRPGVPLGQAERGLSEEERDG